MCRMPQTDPTVIGGRRRSQLRLRIIYIHVDRATFKKQLLAEMMTNIHVFRAHKCRKFDGLVFCRAITQFLLITIFIIESKYSDIV